MVMTRLHYAVKSTVPIRLSEAFGSIVASTYKSNLGHLLIMVALSGGGYINAEVYLLLPLSRGNIVN